MSLVIRKPKNKKLAVLGSIAIVLALIAIVFGGSGIINEPFVETQLKQFGDKITADAREHGAEAEFTHGKITVEGFLFNRRAQVADLKFVFKSQNGLQRNETTFTTPNAIIALDATSINRLNINFPEPITIEDQQSPPAVMTFEGTPHYTVSWKPSTNTAETLHSLSLPPKFTIAPVGEHTPEQVVTVTYDPKPVFESIINREGYRTSTVDLRNLKVVHPENKSEITVASMSSVMKDEPGEGDRRAFDTNITFTDIAYSDDVTKAGPYTFKLSLNGTSALPLDTETGAVEPVNDMDATLRELSLTSDDFSVVATGTVNQKPDDVLPYGTADIIIKNFAKLRDGTLVPTDQKPTLLAALDAITGQPAASAEDVKFTIKREKLGTFYVGNVPFEQLVALVITHSLKHAPAEPKPVELEEPTESSPEQGDEGATKL